MAILRGTLVKIPRPSSSIERSILPRGVRPIRAIFFRCAKGRVCDSLLIKINIDIQMRDLQPYFIRSKTVTLFPTGEKRHDPSGLKSKFPCL
jgi:hypothetical protein